MPEVTCLGILVADLVGKPIDAYPERGKLALVERMQLHSGGCAANTAVALAKLGIKTAIIGKVGSDGLGDFLISTMERNGVDPRGIRRDSEANTAASMVIVHSDGERSFIHSIGANANLTREDVDFDLLEKSKALIVAGALVMPGFDGGPTADTLQWARSRGIITAYDTVWNDDSGWMRKLAPALPFVDYFLPSIEEARRIVNREEPREVAQALLDAGVGTVALKLGEQGCFVKSADIEVTVPAYAVTAVDGTGTGDAFVAGFLTGIVRGWGIERTARLANMVGACCVERLGATAGIVSLDDTLARFSETA